MDIFAISGALNMVLTSIQVSQQFEGSVAGGGGGGGDEGATYFSKHQF